MKNDFVINGDKIILSPLDQSNMEMYLFVYKRASSFSKVYEMMPDFWEEQRRWIEEYVACKRNDIERFLIVEKKTLQGCGYINLDYECPEMPGVDIAILKKYQRKGYASEAAQLLLKKTFEKDTVKSIIWNVFSSNTASCKIAEKLGGVIVKERNLIVDTMREAGFNMDEIDDKESLKSVAYEVRRS